MLGWADSTVEKTWRKAGMGSVVNCEFEGIRVTG